MTNPTPAPASPAALADALEKNQQATDEVKLVAEELAVVHSVLQTKLAEVAKAEGDVESAVARTGEAADKLDKAAETLEHVNQTLAQTAASPVN